MYIYSKYLSIYSNKSILIYLFKYVNSNLYYKHIYNQNIDVVLKIS